MLVFWWRLDKKWSSLIDSNLTANKLTKDKNNPKQQTSHWNLLIWHEQIVTHMEGSRPQNG